MSAGERSQTVSRPTLSLAPLQAEEGFDRARGAVVGSNPHTFGGCPKSKRR